MTMMTSDWRHLPERSDTSHKTDLVMTRLCRREHVKTVDVSDVQDR